MKFIFFLAIRNLFRYYKRTLITAASIALGVTIFVWVDGMLSWTEERSVRNLKNYETATLTIGNSAFLNDEEYLPLEETIENRQQVETELSERNWAFTPEVKFTAHLINDISGESYPFIGFAIQTKSHKNIYKINDAVYEGEFLTDGQQILISKYTTELLNVNLSDYLIVETDTKYDLHNADAFQVVGIFETPNPEVNRNNFYIPLSSADAFLEMEGEVNLIAVKAYNLSDEQLDDLANELEQNLQAAGMADIAVATWEEMAQSFVAVRDGKRGGTTVILGLIFIIVLIGIANTMLMAVYERTGEIGMMRAMGMTKREVTFSFMLESAGVGFIGGLFGMILSTGIIWYMIKYGIDYTPLIGDMSIGYRTVAIIHAQWNPGMMLIGWIFVIISSVLVSLIPARKALNMNIADILAHVGKYG